MNGSEATGSQKDAEVVKTAAAALTSLSQTLRTSTNAASDSNPLLRAAHGHLPPLWGAVTAAMGIPLHETAYVFLFAHARTVLSAAVRASVLGPYQAQAMLGGKKLREWISALVKRWWDVQVEDAGQTGPVMDLWVGRHELLYSRIFNS